MKRLLMVLLCLLCSCGLAASAEADSLLLPGEAANYYAIGVGDDVAVIAWTALEDPQEKNRCFMTMTAVSSSNYLMAFGMEAGTDALMLSKAELLDQLYTYLGATEGYLTESGYTFAAESYLFFGPAPLFPVEEASELSWMEVQIHRAPCEIPSSSAFAIDDSKTVTAGSQVTYTVVLKNTGDEEACIEQIEGLLMLDGRLRVALCEAAEVRTPRAGIQPKDTVPADITVEYPADFSPLAVLPLYTLAEADYPHAVSMPVESELAIGKSGDYCHRLTIPYVEGTDPADYFVACPTYSVVPFELIECFWFMPGEGVLEGDQVVFPLVPMLRDNDATASVQRAYRLTKDASE